MAVATTDEGRGRLVLGVRPAARRRAALAERLAAPGVEVTLLHYDDMPHFFFSFVNLFETSNEAVATVGARLRAVIGDAG